MEDVVKPPHDRKLYRALTLPGGLNVLLISDPDIVVGPSGDGAAEVKTEDGSSSEEEEEEEGSSGSDEEDSDEGSEEEDENGSEDQSGKPKKKGHHAPVKKAAAAMAVGIGSLSDPPDLPGLSHFLEHMLFMGSAKYPNENEYDDFLTKHGGSSNAFTELETTNFHFDVSPGNLKGALDRFAQFFISPLCLESSLEREVQAVDSEFAGVIQDDSCRAAQLMCHTAKPGHVYRKFTWGNKLSLWDQPNAAGINVREAVIDFYRQHYTAERMSLVVLGGEPLDEMQSWVSEIFQGLPSGKGPRPSFEHMGMPFEGRTLYVLPAVRETHEIVATFQLPCLTPHYGAKAEQYISHLVGHEGPGSLLSLLKAHGWATDLSAGVEGDGYTQNSGCYLFSVTITLTEAGLNAGQGFGLAPIELLFSYLSMLRQKGPQHWVWQELKNMAEMRFMFMEEEEGIDMCTRLAAVMHLYPREHIMVAEYLHQEYNPDLIMSLLDSCMHPSKSSYRLDLLTKAYEPLKQQLVQQASSKTGLLQSATANGQSPSVSVETEPWFNMESAWVQVPDSVCQSWASAPPHPSLQLPPPNPYIPTDFTIKRHRHHRCSHAQQPQPQPQQQQQQQQHGGEQNGSTPSKRARTSGPHSLDAGPGPAITQANVSASEASAAAAGASAANAAHASATDAAAAAAEEATACAELAGKLGLPVVLATPPELIYDAPGLRVWQKLDRAFSTPRVVTYLRLRSPVLGSSPKAKALNHLMLRLLDDALNEDTYLADVAGLHYHASPEGMGGIEFKVEGFSHRLPLLAKRLISALSTGAPLRANWDTVREGLIRKYRNTAMEVIKQASYERLFALCRHSWHWSTVTPHVEGATPAEVEAFLKELLQMCHLEAFMHGNIEAEEAGQVAAELQQALGPGCCASSSNMPRDLTIIVPSASDLNALHHTPSMGPINNTTADGCAEAAHQAGTANGAAADGGSAASARARGPETRQTRASAAMQQQPEREAKAHSPQGGAREAHSSPGRGRGKKGAEGHSAASHSHSTQDGQSKEGHEPDSGAAKGGGSKGKARGAAAGKETKEGKAGGKVVEKEKEEAGQQGGAQACSASGLPFHAYPGVVHQAEARNPAEENAALEAYFQVGPAASCPRSLALMDIADHLLCEPLYNQLRTKEQLGYTVHSGTRLTYGVGGLAFIIVSAVQPAHYLDARLEAFIQEFIHTKVANLTPSELAQQVAALTDNKLSRDRALSDESGRHWEKIWNERYDFLEKEQEVAALQALTPDDVRAWFATYLGASSPQRCKLAVHVLPRVASCPAAAPPPRLPVLPLHALAQRTGGEHLQEGAGGGPCKKDKGGVAASANGSHGSGAGDGEGERGGDARQAEGVVEGSKVWLVPDLVALKSSRPVWEVGPAQLPGKR